MSLVLGSVLLTLVSTLSLSAQPFIPAFRIGKGAASGLGLSADERYLAVSSTAYLELFDATTLERLAFASAFPNGPHPGRVYLAPDGSELSLCSDQGITRYGLPSLHPDEQLPDGIMAAYSPDGRLWAWFGKDKTLHIRNRPTQEELAAGKLQTSVDLAALDPKIELGSLLDPRGIPLVFSGDSHFLAVGLLHEIHIWDTVANRQEMVLTDRQEQGLGDEVRGLRFSPDSRFLLSSHLRYQILWNLSTGEEIHRWAGDYSGQFAAVPGTFAPSGAPLLAVAAGRDTVYLWDLTKNQQAGALQWNDTEELGGAIFSPDGRLLALGSHRTGTVQIWDLERHQTVASLHGPGRSVLPLSFSPDGSHLLNIRSDGSQIERWDLVSHQMQAKLDYPIIYNTNDASYGTNYAISPDSHRLVTVGPLDSLVVWDMTLQQKLATVPGVPPVAFPAAELLVVGRGPFQNIPVWDLAVNQQVGELKNDFVIRALFSGSHNRVAIFTVDVDHHNPIIHIWDVAQQEQSAEISIPIETRPTFSPDWRWMAVGNTLWDLAQQSPIPESWIGINWNIKAFTPDGRIMAYAREDSVCFYDLFKRQLVSHAELEGPLVDCFFTADGNKVVLVGEEWIEVRSYPTLEPLGHVAVHREGDVLSPDGRWLATRNGATVNLWQIPALLPAGTLEGHTGQVNSMTFSPDSRHLITTSDDYTLMVWESSDNTAVENDTDNNGVLPENTHLLPSFPNPANPQVWIPYVLAKNGDARISVFNIAGQLVSRIDLGRRSAGYYTGQAAAYWDGHDHRGQSVSSGIYIAVLESGGVMATGKVVLLR